MTGWTQDDIDTLREKGLEVKGLEVKGLSAERESEHSAQVRLFRWATRPETLREHPALDMLLAVPNGGHRHPATAKKLQRSGVRPGVPDLLLPVPTWHRDRLRYAGLWIELKVGQNDLSPYQDMWMRALEKKGYAVCTCWGFDQARAALTNYLTEPHSFVSGL